MKSKDRYKKEAIIHQEIILIRKFKKRNKYANNTINLSGKLKYI